MNRSLALDYERAICRDFVGRKFALRDLRAGHFAYPATNHYFAEAEEVLANYYPAMRPAISGSRLSRKTFHQY